MKSFKKLVTENNLQLPFLNKKKQSTPEDKPTGKEKPKSKVIVMKGNEITTGGDRVSRNSNEIVVKPKEQVVVPTRQPHQKQLPSPIYTVGDNDTVKGIAMRHGLSEKEFMELNKGVKDPNKLRPGTKVRTRRGQ